MQKEVIIKYYKDIGLQPIFSLLDLFTLLGHYNNVILVSDNRISRGIAKLLRIKRTSVKRAIDEADTYFPLKEAIANLTDRGIAVYFISRIDQPAEIQDFSERAKFRMKNDIDFITMLKNIDKYADDFKELLGEKYSTEYIKDLAKIPQIVKKGNLYRHEDIASNLVNVVCGLRITSHQPSNAKNKIHVYGRCGAFGYAVEDSETIPSQLQKMINNNSLASLEESKESSMSSSMSSSTSSEAILSLAEYCVINHGLWGAEDSQIDSNFLNEAKEFKTGDVVLFYRKAFTDNVMKRLINCGMVYKEIDRDFYTFPETRWCFYNQPGHMNRDGYKIVAQLIYDYLKRNNFACGKNTDSLNSTESWDTWLKNNGNNILDNEINEYINAVKHNYPISTNEKIKKHCGAIVMNCNPFTLGHRYLIEYASAQVEMLYIFVVEEDKSFFKFVDRFDMVKAGTQNIKNVVVIPSGKFMISALTFPQYFMKDYVKTKDFDVSSDLELFCTKIAPEFNISVRFVGEEPFDPVTAHYNEEMRRIFPVYGLQFCEIPRKMDGDGNYINATLVRQLMHDKDYEKIRTLVPETTYNVLENKYF